MKTAEIECQRVVAMATNFGTKIAINWLCVDDSDQAIGYEGGLSGRRQNANIADTMHPRDVAMATRFSFRGAVTSLYDSQRHTV